EVRAGHEGAVTLTAEEREGRRERVRAKQHLRANRGVDGAFESRQRPADDVGTAVDPVDHAGSPVEQGEHVHPTDAQVVRATKVRPVDAIQAIPEATGALLERLRPVAQRLGCLLAVLAATGEESGDELRPRLPRMSQGNGAGAGVTTR